MDCGADAARSMGGMCDIAAMHGGRSIAGMSGVTDNCGDTGAGGGVLSLTAASAHKAAKNEVQSLKYPGMILKLSGVWS